MGRKPEYQAIRPGDIIELPEGKWYVEGVRFMPGSESYQRVDMAVAYAEFQTDLLTLNLRRVNEVEE